MKNYTSDKLAMLLCKEWGINTQNLASLTIELRAGSVATAECHYTVGVDEDGELKQAVKQFTIQEIDMTDALQKEIH